MPERRKTRRCDVAVVGAGTAGLNASRAARSAGAQTILVDEAFAGTTCADVGCMPSKLLIAAACAAQSARSAGEFGVRTSVRVDGAAVMERVRRLRDHFVASEKRAIAKIPDKLRARARFVDARTLELDSGDRIEARAIVIATGSRSVIPDGFHAVEEDLLTNENVFELRTLPRTLAVLGAGALGLELAQAFARLGVKVDVFDHSRAVNRMHDRVVEREVRTHLAKELGLHLGVAPLTRKVGERIELRWAGHHRLYDRVLVASGRPPALQGLGLETTGLRLDEHGVPRFDPHTMRCGRSSIFIAGDADQRRPVLHEAADDGRIAGHNAARYPRVTRHARKVRLTITFTEPSIAVVGEDFDGSRHELAEASFVDQGRAKVMALEVGCARLYADDKTLRLRGATVFGPAAEHLGHLLAWAIGNRATADELLKMPIYHPTFEEGLKTALQHLAGHGARRARH